jgi:hypothetical protein
MMSRIVYLFSCGGNRGADLVAPAMAELSAIRGRELPPMSRSVEATAIHARHKGRMQ